MKDSKFTPPKPATGDTAHRVVKGILSPLAGAGELFEHFVSPPMGKRLDQWREYVGDALYLIEQNFGFELEKLQANEKFITVVVQATRIAVQNHQKEKLNALRNAIISSALNPEINDDLQLIYIRFVDELEPSHLFLLKFFVEFENEFTNLRSYPDIFAFVCSHFEQIKALSRDEFKMLMGDLSVRGLIRISKDIGDFDGIYEFSSIGDMRANEDLPRIIVTKIAKGFIEFISNKDLFKTKDE